MARNIFFRLAPIPFNTQQYKNAMQAAYRWSKLNNFWKFAVIVFLILFIFAFMKRYSDKAILSDFSSDTLLNSPTVVDSNFVDSNLSYFATAKGRIHIDEITKNVFNKYDYLFIKNDLIPILAKKNPISCEEIFIEWQKIADNGLTLVPPKQLPNPEAFLLNNYSKLESYFRNNVPNNEDKSISIWNETNINNLVDIAKQDPYKVSRPYGNQASVYMATKFFNVNGQVGAVIGSLTPWVETFILANGAKNVSTIDYKKVKITHPQMNFIYAPELPSLQKELNNHFDFIVSYSSIEHSGLGRYGDPMDPIGDIREMNKIHCLLKKEGILFVGFPVGEDTIYYNVHRIYGRMRLAMMFEGFQLLEVFYGTSPKPIKLTQEILERKNVMHQYLFVLQKNK